MNLRSTKSTFSLTEQGAKHHQNLIKILTNKKFIAAVLVLVSLGTLSPRAYGQGGVPIWTNRYNVAERFFASPVALATDRSGNVFVTGSAGNGDYHIATVKGSVR